VKKQSFKWLDRRISAPGPHLCLCLSEAEYKKAMKHLKIEDSPRWISNDHANATAHNIFSSRGLVCVVCLGDCSGRNAIEIAGLLIHEAVHAWQEWCDYYGEKNPGSEQEAYAVQSIAQELLAEYARRIS